MPFQIENLYMTISQGSGVGFEKIRETRRVTFSALHDATLSGDPSCTVKKITPKNSQIFKISRFVARVSSASGTNSERVLVPQRARDLSLLTLSFPQIFIVPPPEGGWRSETR